jgi:hypothetical protein
MTKTFRLTLFALFAFCPFLSRTFAQDLSDKVGIWFLEERFIIADLNDDALLEKAELQTFPTEFAYYLQDRNYDHADRNRDGFLSFNEINHLLPSELAYRNSVEKREIRSLEADFSLLNSPSLQYLMDRPELVVRLFGNCTWLFENPALAESLYRNHFWTSEHPEVLVSLHKNLLWMASNPLDAKQLYENRSTTRQLPELLGWRADHVDFMRRYPKLLERYNLGQTLPVIRVNR